MDHDNVVPLRGPRRRKAAPPPAGVPIAGLIDSWKLALKAANKSPATIASYARTVRDLSRWLAEQDMPVDTEGIEPEHLRAWLAAVADDTSPGNAAKHYRNLSVFWNWGVHEKERTPPSPMARVDRITVARKAHQVFSDDELRALVRACSGNSFEDRRDLAIIRTFIDNGIRVSGMAGLRYTPGKEDTHDVFLSQHVLRVTLKGGRVFWAPIGRKAAAAIDRYIRARARHPRASSPWLWLPIRDRATAEGEHRFTLWGIEQMLERRGRQAGLTSKAHPHKFRRTMATKWTGDALQLMRIGGWESLDMVRLYTSAREDELARRAHAEHSPGDRI